MDTITSTSTASSAAGTSTDKVDLDASHAGESLAGESHTSDGVRPGRSTSFGPAGTSLFDSAFESVFSC